MSERPFTPDWFWEIIDSTHPDLLALAKRLEQLDREQLLIYYHFYEVASGAVCHQWDGPYIDGGIEHLSEDSTKDLTDWVVSNGNESWLRATEPNANLAELFWLSAKVDTGKVDEPARWTLDVSNDNRQGFQSPKEIAIPIFEERFKEDFYESLTQLREEL